MHPLGGLGPGRMYVALVSTLASERIAINCPTPWRVSVRCALPRVHADTIAEIALSVSARLLIQFPCGALPPHCANRKCTVLHQGRTTDFR